MTFCSNGVIDLVIVVNNTAIQLGIHCFQQVQFVVFNISFDMYILMSFQD